MLLRIYPKLRKNLNVTENLSKIKKNLFLF